MIHSGQVRYHDALEPLLVDIDSVSQHPDNYNNGDVDELMELILDVGMYRPIEVQASTAYIAAGNTTWEACKTLGATRIPVVSLDIDDTTTYKIMVGDNEIARLARPDRGQLARLLDQLMEVEGKMPPVGRTAEDLAALHRIADIPVSFEAHRDTWPTLTFTVPPHVKEAFYELTDAATDPQERFELLLRLAGWQ
jgi:hypothetical protein